MNCPTGMNWLRHDLNFVHELHALRALWKYYNNAKLRFAIHEIYFNSLSKAKIHENAVFNSLIQGDCRATLAMTVKEGIAALTARNDKIKNDSLGKFRGC